MLLRPVAQNLTDPSQRPRRGRWLLAVALLVLLAGAIGLNGCGGGSGSSGGSNNPPPPATRSVVSGAVTDPTGLAIVGAAVNLNGQTATSTQAGTYVIPNVPAGIGTISATATVNGQRWSGQNTVEVISGESNTSNINLVLSPDNQQGAITGTVRDAQGRGLAGAKVFAATAVSSVYTIAGNNGSYTLSHLPAGQYTLTASLAGFLNQTVTNVAVAASATPTTASFTLNTSNGNSTVPAVTDLAVLSLTLPDTPTRAASHNQNDLALNAIRWFILKRRGLLGRRAADPRKITLLHQVKTRATPTGSIIENDLFWQYTELNNLFGYTVLRSINTDTQFVPIALLRDPLAFRFADLDAVLTPDVTYFYSVARLDTINFPNNGAEGPPAEPPVAARPLGPLALTSPNEGATSAGPPTFAWSAVPRAQRYQILVYDRFPTLAADISQPGNDPNAVLPIWPADANNPGTSLVDAPATSQLYQGPALQPGTRYFWTVLAFDQANSAVSISPIRSFVAQ
ncbi:MAG TPA: carboxypeptidase-like regulatory domain-containing protein [Chthonomonadaceae bacterium]|nr:carboxypeptidase-like regulatory domain-containing protein [Chthonomonadaceae bacterium]